MPKKHAKNQSRRRIFPLCVDLQYQEPAGSRLKLDLAGVSVVIDRGFSLTLGIARPVSSRFVFEHRIEKKKFQSAAMVWWF